MNVDDVTRPPIEAAVRALLAEDDIGKLQIDYKDDNQPNVPEPSTSLLRAEQKRKAPHLVTVRKLEKILKFF